MVAPGADDGIVEVGVEAGDAMHLAVSVGISALEFDAVERPGSGGDDLILFVEALQLAVAFHFELEKICGCLAAAAPFALPNALHGGVGVVVFAASGEQNGGEVEDQEKLNRFHR